MTRRIADLELSGDLVRLRPHRREDAPAAFRMLSGREEILRWLVWDGPADVSELEAHYAAWRRVREGQVDLNLALEDRGTGELVGSMALRFAGHPGQGDVGYWVGVEHQRRGLGSEALALTAHLAFTHLGATSLYAWVFVGNRGSRRALERTGFTLARTAGGRVTKGGRRVEEWHFVLLDREWRRLHGAFAPRSERVTWEDAPDAEADPFDGLFDASPSARKSAGDSPADPRDAG